MLLLLATAASAATLTVGSSGYASIQAAIDAASPGDSVVVDPGVWSGMIDLRGKAIAVRSRDGAEATTLVGGAGAWTVVMQSGEPAGASLSGFTIANPGGAGIVVSGGGNPTLSNLAFTGNGAYGSWLPALYVSGASATLSDATFTGNGSQYGGGVLAEYGTLTMDRVNFSGDIAWYGGALYAYLEADVVARDCTFTGEEAAVGGGAVYVATTATVALERTTFADNVADTSHGGAIYAESGATVVDTDGVYSGNLVLDYDTLGTVGGAVASAGATLAFTGTTFEENTGYRGGGVYASGGTVAFDSVTLAGNYAIQAGGAWLSEGAALTDVGSTWSKNTSYDVGGALVGYNTFTATQEGATFSENLSTYSHGGAVYGGTVGTYACTSCTFTDNTAYYYGGAMFFSELYGTATLSDVTIDGNRGTYGYGGGIYAQYYSDLVIAGATLHGNQSYMGGGLYAYYRSGVSITDATFSGNVADPYAAGGLGVVDAGLSDRSLTLDRVEISDNAAENEGGGALVQGLQTVTVTGSHLLRNRAGTSSFGGGLFARGNATLVAQRNQVTGNTAGYGGGVYVDGTTRSATWTNNILTENAAGVGGAFCLVGGGGAVWTNNTFVGNGATDKGGTGCLYETSVTFRDNLVAWTDPGAAIHDYTGATASKSDYAYNAWFGNAAGDGSGAAASVASGQGAVTADPGVVAYTRDGDDGNDNLRLLRDSPLLDAGDPELTDPDGSRADIGAYGGPGAPAGDADGDGYDASSDCDDADPTVHPGADDAWYDGVNADCTGASDFDQDGDGVDAADQGGEDCDDTDPTVTGPCEDTETPGKGGGGEEDPGGCGCASGGGGVGWAFVAGMVLVARRRARG